MSRHRPAVVPFLAVALVALAGCSAFGGSAPTSTETLTPASVPEETVIAPGVPAGDGPVTIDAERLLAADAGERAAGYQLRRGVTVRGTNWTTRIERERRVDRDGTLYERVRTYGSAAAVTPSIARSDLWTNDSATYVRTFDGDGNRIEEGRFPTAPSHFEQWPTLREQVLKGATYRVQPTAEGAVLRSADLPTLPATLVPLSLREPRNVTARVVVTERGLVRSLRVAYDTTFQGEPVRVTIEHRTTAVGTTAVDRPDWVG